MKWLDTVVSMVRFCGFYLLVSVEAVLHSKFNLLTMSQRRDKDPPPNIYTIQNHSGVTLFIIVYIQMSDDKHIY